MRAEGHSGRIYKGLQRRLTLACVAGTVLVLVLMAVASLLISLHYYFGQGDEGFQSSMSNIIFYLQGRQVIDQTWLARTEANNDLYIRIDAADGDTFSYTGQHAQRRAVTEQARQVADEHNFFGQLRSNSDGDEPFMLWYTIESEGQSWRAGVALVSYGNGSLALTVVKSMAGEMATARNLVLGFVGSVAAAAVLLALFSWFFTGRALRPAKRAAEQQAYFVSAASHELRTPLSVIQMSAGSILSVPEKTEVYVEKIERECQQMRVLVSDMLTLASGDAGLRLQLRPVAPGALLDEAAERFEAAAAQKGVALERRCGEALPEVAVDGGRMRQLLDILLDNALRHTPAGGTVRLGAALKKRQLVLSVEDSGPGVPDAEKSRVFERFYQADESRTEGEHFGLGLSVAQEIAAAHGGTVTAKDSELGGARFVVKVPARAARAGD